MNCPPATTYIHTSMSFPVRVLLLDILFLIQACAGGSSSFVEINFSVEPESAMILPDSSALLHCALEGRAAKLATIKWKKDGDILSSNTATTTLYPNGSLAVSASSRVYRTEPGLLVEGVYQCLAIIPSVGNILSKKATVDVLSPLLPSDVEQTHKVYFGENMLFPCIDEDSGVLRNMQKDIELNFTWYHDGDVVKFDRSKTNLLQTGSLELVNLVGGDSGVYHCEVTHAKTNTQIWRGARNVLEVDEDPVESVYSRSPVFVLKPAVVTRSRIGTDVIFECGANGWPKPNITWLKEGVTMDLTHSKPAAVVYFLNFVCIRSDEEVVS
ncbi:unnamed protein product [Notodromas monacha]|uniref:Ig-like domain-containing protein n=1 Tax=Notodromas monacha TaxID=399045 RepID=A0A7R9BKD2_9CRUS|nr:unnamed protein product [Notodromas monacha]CAG0917095.1 unnamed protein product [Notodromas monacha]